jgi:hypothetical protein
MDFPQTGRSQRHAVVAGNQIRQLRGAPPLQKGDDLALQVSH